MATNSLGIMMIVIVFCSAPASVIICMRRSSRPAGFCMITSAACRSCSAASRAPGEVASLSAQAGEGAAIVDAETGRVVERYPPPERKNAGPLKS
jgi:hypothetical protein